MKKNLRSTCSIILLLFILLLSVDVLAFGDKGFSYNQELETISIKDINGITQQFPGTTGVSVAFFIKFNSKNLHMVEQLVEVANKGKQIPEIFVFFQEKVEEITLPPEPLKS